MITKTRKQKSVEIVIIDEEKFANVLWVDEIIENGNIIASSNFRCSYGKSQKDDFIAKVDGQEDYLRVLGW